MTCFVFLLCAMLYALCTTNYALLLLSAWPAGVKRSVYEWILHVQWAKNLIRLRVLSETDIRMVVEL